MPTFGHSPFFFFLFAADLGCNVRCFFVGDQRFIVSVSALVCEVKKILWLDGSSFFTLVSVHEYTLVLLSSTLRDLTLGINATTGAI